MAKLSKRNKHNTTLVKLGKSYSVAEAVQILKKGHPTKFDSSVDLQLKLNADPNASDQVVRGTTTLPHGTGKEVRVVVLTKNEGAEDIKKAGALEVGGLELVEKINKGWLDFDVVVAHPTMMRDIAKLGRVLGPRGLMPSPKAGTVAENLVEVVKEIKKGRIEFKMDKQANVSSSVGRLSFKEQELVDNAQSMLSSIVANTPKSIKGHFIQSAHLSSTMGPGVKLDVSAYVQEGAEE